MENLKMSLTTFLKFSASTNLGKIRALQTLTSPGGYDFYKVMKKLVRELATGTVDIKDAYLQIAKIKQSAERQHTLEAIARFAEWLADTNPVTQMPPKGVYKSSSGLVQIKLEPEFAFLVGGKVRVCMLWNLKKPVLSAPVAAKGLCLLKRELCKSPAMAFDFFDLRSKKFVTEQVISPSTELQVTADLGVLETLWHDVHNPSVSIEESISHISALSIPPPPT